MANENNKNLVKCKVCSGLVATSARRCPHCGARLKMHPVLGCFLWVVGLFVLFIIVTVFLFLFTKYR